MIWKLNQLAMCKRLLSSSDQNSTSKRSHANSPQCQEGKGLMLLESIDVYPAQLRILRQLLE
jgi:hypothetical protein